MDTNGIMQIFKILGEPNRLKIVELLSKGEKCACELLEDIKIPQPTLSHNMKLLCDSGLIRLRREGKWANYSINTDVLEEIKGFLGDI